MVSNKRKRTRTSYYECDEILSGKGRKRPCSQPAPHGGPPTGLPLIPQSGQVQPGQSDLPPPVPLSAPHTAIGAPTAQSLAVQRAQQNLNTPFGGLPTEIIELIFQGVLDNWIATPPHRQDIMQRSQRGGAPQGQPYSLAAIANEPYPLVLTPHSCLGMQHSFMGMAWPLNADERLQAAAEYARYRRGLLEPGRISSRYREVYRNFLARTVKVYVNIAEVEYFFDTFYAKIGPPSLVVPWHSGRPFIVIFPWYTFKMWDIMPLMARLIVATRLQVEQLWAINLVPAGGLTHGQQIMRCLFAPTGSLREYMSSTAPNATRIARLRFRAQSVQRQGRPKLEIWFQDGENAPDWVNGEAWAWPHPAGLVRANPSRTSARRPRLGMEPKPRSNADRHMQKAIGDFLQSVGLQDAEVRRIWDIGLGIDGMHSELGWNIRRAR